MAKGKVMQKDSHDGNLLCDPAGASSEPVKVGDQPEPSVAWPGGDPGCEAYTGSLYAA